MSGFVDRQPFGFRFGYRRLGDARGWDGPRDDLGSCGECGGRIKHDPECPEREKDRG